MLRIVLSGALAFAFCAFAAPVWAQSVSPGEARIDSTDAHRFAALFEAYNGAPPADALQSHYIDGAGAGLKVFLESARIKGAEELAAYVADNQDKYRRGIDVCLPIAENAEKDLRTIYLKLHGLVPDRPLPEVHVVFGQGNSGGTAQPGVLVLGLEVICATNDTPEAIGAALRRFFAHETVHTWQTVTDEQLLSDPLGYSVLKEGIADYFALAITGEVPVPARDQWAREREAWLWEQFQSDRARLIELSRSKKTLEALAGDEEAQKLVLRWVSNYNRAPKGWPYEVGYWIGRRIVEAYIEQAPDKEAALDAVIELEDADAIIVQSEYGTAF